MIAPQSDDDMVAVCLRLTVVTSRAPVATPTQPPAGVAVEGEDHVVDRIAVVDHVVETAHGVSLLVQEHRVAVAGAYLPQRKYLGGSLVQTVDLCGRYAVRGEYAADGLAAGNDTLRGPGRRPP